MTSFKLTYQKGATPLDLDEASELIPKYISTQGDLNELEQSNIANAFLWAQRANLDHLLTATFILTLHKKMFADVWKWAGKSRSSNKNIGVAKEQIMEELGLLLQDTKYWIEHNTFDEDEIAARFHQRLVRIHVFPNGNGRHARLTTDLLLKRLGQPAFTWGSSTSQNPLETEGPTRKSYIAALKEADLGDYRSLLIFARS